MEWTEGEVADSIPGRFQRQVARSAGQPAIVEDERTLTYAGLDALAARYVRAVSERCPGTRLRGRVIALLLPHGGDLIAGALAACRCGAAVVALNPSDPPARLASIRSELEPAMVVTHAQQLRRARGAGFSRPQLMIVDDLSEEAQGDSDWLPSPDDVAFMICTSGSSGRPKVVMHSHRNVLHNVLRYTNGIGIEANDRIAWLASLSGGQGLATVWTALLNGATLCPFPIMDRGVTGLGSWLRDQRISVLDTVPSVLRSFARTLHGERLAGIRLVRLASEAGLRTDFDLFRRHFSDECVLASVLASSETGIVAQALLHADDQPPDGALTVGTAAEGLELLLLDEAGEPVSAGASGEIVVSSRYLALGYRGDEALTAARFEAWEGARRFRTGDLGRRSADGALTVIGRTDSQVKVRGHRLQLEEVESALAAQPGVAAATVVVRRTAGGDAKLTAYMAPTPGSSAAATGPRHSLSVILPPHAIPAEFVWVEQLPLTPHGKVDRERLAELAPAGPPVGQRAPSSDTEELLLAIWRYAFERDDIGVDGGFLELGGDSLTAAVIAAEAYDVFGVQLELGAFASETSVARMAELVEQRTSEGIEHGVPQLNTNGGKPRGLTPPPASLAQRSMWPVAQRNPQHLTMACAYRILGPLDVRALERSVADLIRRHEILRTTCAERDGELIQLIHPYEAERLAVQDLRGEPAPHTSAADVLATEAARPFELERGPLLRFRLLRLGDEEHQLLRINHHLITDAPSWRIFLEELAVAYEAHMHGASSSLPQEAALQYADYAVWERQRLTVARPAGYEAEIDWWQRRLERPPAGLLLPFARTDAGDQAAAAGGLIEWGLSVESTAALDRLGREAGATFFMTRLAVFAALLALDSGAEDMLIEMFLTMRRRPELQRMIGLFINRALLRLRFSGRPTLRDWLATVRGAVIETSEHTTIPDRRLWSELGRRGVRPPAVDVKFGVSHQPPAMRFGGLELEPLPRRPTPPPRFTLNVDRHYEASRCRAEFDHRTNDPERVVAFLARLQRLVQAACSEPDVSLQQLHDALASAA